MMIVTSYLRGKLRLFARMVDNLMTVAYPAAFGLVN